MQRDGFQQFVQTLTRGCRYFDVLCFTGHLFNDDLVLQQVRTDFVRVGFVFVDLVDRHDHRHLGRFRVVNRFDRLRHHSIIRRDHQNDDVGDLRTARPHRGKGRVARCIEEAQNLTVVGCDLIGTDVLRDTARFAGLNLGFADRVKQRCLTVVNVAHDRDDRRTRDQIFRIVFGFLDHVFNVSVGNTHHFVAEFLDDQLGCVSVDGFVLRDHHAVCHQCFDNGTNAFGHPVRQFGNHDRRRQVNVAHDLFTLNRTAHCLLALAFLLAFHLRHGPLTATFATGQSLVQRQFAGTTAIVATLVALVGFLAVAFFLAGRRGRCAGFDVRRTRRGRGRCGGCGSGCCGFRFFLAALVLFGFRLQAFLALALFGFFRLDLGTTTLAVFRAGLFLGCACFGFFRLAGAGSLNRLQPAFHFGIGDPCRTLGGIPERWIATAAGFCASRFGHHNALALGLDHDVFRPPVAKALLYVAGTRRRSPQAQCLFAVTIAHEARLSFRVTVATLVYAHAF